jgi:hypothetical protein
MSRTHVTIDMPGFRRTHDARYIKVVRTHVAKIADGLAVLAVEPDGTVQVGGSAHQAGGATVTLDLTTMGTGARRHAETLLRAAIRDARLVTLEIVSGRAHMTGAGRPAPTPVPARW